MQLAKVGCRWGDEYVQKECFDDCLGDVIKSARVIKEMTQPQLAGLLGISTRYLKMIECNGRKPSYKLLVRIIHELDIPLELKFHLDGSK